MATLAEIRAQYPQYDDLSDVEIADRLYRKFYSDMPRADFNKRIGFVADPLKTAAGPVKQAETSTNAARADDGLPQDAGGLFIDSLLSGAGKIGGMIANPAAAGAAAAAGPPGRLGAALQGATIGTADEIAGGFGGVMDWLGFGPEGAKGTFSGGYDRTVGKARKQLDDYRQAYPIESAVAQVPGHFAFRMLPQMAGNAVNAAALPGDVYAGRVDPLSDEGIGRATDLAGLVTLGSGVVPAKPNTLRAGAKIGRGKSSPSKESANQIEQSTKSEFYFNMPLYHGTDRSFSAFSLAKGGATTGAAPGRMGVWSALDPAVAEEFALTAAGKSGGNAQIYPLVHRAKKSAVIELDGDEKNHEIASTIDYLWGNGYDAVLLRNYTTPGGLDKQQILVVRDPAQLRSPAAAFDPAKKYSPDLLAAGGPGGIVPGTAATLPNDREKSLPDILAEALKNR